MRQRKCREKMIGTKLQNMEEMQNVIQNASEISDKESVKQTSQLGRIEMLAPGGISHFESGENGRL